ncbi:site-specific DNA-methyltransferase [Desulfovibrio falkowii]|uniref:site-specific DNA-methyltransferase n=1 Tax=Desulfovibrio sp. WGS1351 TaxID=3366814 RepID=UPI00372D535C
MDKIDGLSMDMEQAEREKLAAVFPQCFVEGRLDIDKLLNLCGEYIIPESEKYEFRWQGKHESLRLAQQRSTATLRPCPEESVDFDTTQNLYIEGDNLEVLKLLQTPYYRKVKMIYIDPPYNTGNDFVYEDDFRDTLARYKEVTSQTTKSNPESMGRFHTNWLNMMYPRLRLAASLLRDDGVIFISIDDNEQANLKKLCDEVFGEENFVATVIWQKVYSPKNSAKHFSEDHDFILVYARNAEQWRPRLLPRTEEMTARYINPDNDPRGPWKPGDLSARNYYGEGTYQITCPSGRVIEGPPTGRYWVVSQKKFQEMETDGRIWWGENGDNNPSVKRFLSEVQDGAVPQTLWFYKDVGHTQEAKKELLAAMSFNSSDDVFETPKPRRLIQRMLRVATAPHENDIVLDFFSGSGTTGHAVMELNKEDGSNRHFILVQLPELTGSEDYPTIAEMGKERLRKVGAQINESARQKPGKKQDAQLSLMDAVSTDSNESHPLDTGFKVFKLDSSNLKTWDGTPVSGDQHELVARINSMVDRVKPDRSDMDMVYEIMLKIGVPLTYSVTPVDIDGKTAYSVREDCLLLICLENGITAEMVEKMAEYAPAKIILAESGLADDTAMSNAHYILRDRGIELKLV